VERKKDKVFNDDEQLLHLFCFYKYLKKWLQAHSVENCKTLDTRSKTSIVCLKKRHINFGSNKFTSFFLTFSVLEKLSMFH